MSIINSPYLRTTRDFPEDNQHLRMELIKMYVDVANATNARVVGLFPTNRPAITGEEWFLTANKQQTIRQIYRVTGTGNIAHGINMANIAGFTRIYGTFTDGSIWYTLPYVDASAADNQIQLTVTSTNIVITAGSGSPPTVSSGFVVLEWLAQV